MNIHEFCQRLAEILDIDQVKPEDTLEGFEQWDSLAVLSVLAMVDSKYNVTIAAKDIRGAVTAGDLARLVEAKQTETKPATA
jgi:acyl carrier protein